MSYFRLSTWGRLLSLPGLYQSPVESQFLSDELKKMRKVKYVMRNVNKGHATAGRHIIIRGGVVKKPSVSTTLPVPNQPLVQLERSSPP